MGEVLAQVGPAWILVCAAGLAVVALLVILAAQRRRRKKPPGEPKRQPRSPIDAIADLDTPAVERAIREAKTRGQQDQLPSLYYVLAHRTIETGETAKAQELLRMSIRSAETAGQGQVHAQARVTLGDLAHTEGDLTTACEHWQIARAIFVELKQHVDHEAVEARMLRNGCPTDWVLTDF